MYGTGRAVQFDKKDSRSVYTLYKLKFIFFREKKINSTGRAAQFDINAAVEFIPSINSLLFFSWMNSDARCKDAPVSLITTMLESLSKIKSLLVFCMDEP
ncbi:MAG: hypothetical protein K5839_07380 [Treponemataceae bacterium]|nr:hypothetical protein [Treponemataceae bacterium]